MEKSVKHVSRQLREKRKDWRKRKLEKQREKKKNPKKGEPSNLMPFCISSPTFLVDTIPQKFRQYFSTQYYSLSRILFYIGNMKASLEKIYSWQDKKVQAEWSALQPTQYFYGEFQEFLSCFRNYATIRYRMKKLLYHWKYKQLAKKKLNSEDPFTLMPCKKPVRLYDTRMKGYWEFEASALKEYICSKLMYHEELILEPQMPCHPLTNVPFSFQTMEILLKQFYQYQMMPWICESFLQYKGDLKRLSEDFSIPMKKQCLQMLVRDTRDQNFIYLFEDFLADEFDYHDIINTPRQSLILRVVQNYANENYAKTWITLFTKYYSRRISGDIMTDIHPEMAEIHRRSHLLIYHRMVLDQYRRRINNPQLRL